MRVELANNEPEGLEVKCAANCDFAWQQSRENHALPLFELM